MLFIVLILPPSFSRILHSTYFTSADNERSDVTQTTATFLVTSRLLCAIICERNDHCDAASFHSQMDSCELMQFVDSGTSNSSPETILEGVFMRKINQCTCNSICHLYS